MYKIKTGDIFFSKRHGYYKITNICKELLKESAHNTAITVQFLSRPSPHLTPNLELNVSYEQLIDWESKYLGRNLKAAQILYGYNYRKEQEYAQNDVDSTFKLIDSISKRQDN